MSGAGSQVGKIVRVAGVVLSAVPVGIRVSCWTGLLAVFTGVFPGVESQGNKHAVNIIPENRIIVRINFMMRDSTTQDSSRIGNEKVQHYQTFPVYLSKDEPSG